MMQFEKIRSHTIPSLQASVEEYLEPVSGARHIHLATTGADLVFLVGFPTVPDADDGRAHILEHLSLCGSQRYPVRDPFFTMMRRSTATFMNAFTYADRTVYPFASTNEKDFANLLDIYLDAAFFPNLDYLNFLQEGWRYTLQDGKLGYQGVVFNEMKGAFIDPTRALYRGITSTMLEGTTYEVESGGDPLAIPQLTHQMLKDFHASHYHPSQAVFMTAGPMAADSVQRQIVERVLQKLPGGSPRRVPQLAEAPAAPRHTVVKVPSQEARADEFGVQLTWLLGESTDPKTLFDARLLSAGLLGDASSPLRKAMETAGYGRPSKLNGHDDSARQVLFHIGMEGLTEPQVAQAQAHIEATLAQAAASGVPQATLQAALRDLKFSQRDTSSNGMPNVLQRMLVALPVAMRDGDVMNAFDSDPVLQQLEQDIADPAYFKRLVQSLLDSPARQISTIVPDAQYFSRRDEIERAALAEREAFLSVAERTRIQEETAALAAHQQRAPDTRVLPRILPGDVSTKVRPLPAIEADAGGIHAYDIASNGISYANVVYDLSDLPAADWQWMNLYAQLRSDLGIEDHDYATAGAWRQRMVPLFGVGMQALQSTTGDLRLDLTYVAGGLREEHANIVDVLRAYVVRPRFDEHARLGYLVERMVQDKLNSLGQSGSSYALMAVAAPLSDAYRFQDTTSGASALPFYVELGKLAGTAAGLAQIASELQRMHGVLLARSFSLVCGGSGDDGRQLAQLLAAALPSPAPVSAPAPAPAAASATVGVLPLANLALYATSQVNHCMIAWQAPSMDDSDAAPLAIAAALLSSQVLHQALRERGGAYGGSASYSGDIGVFSMGSYRDPRLAGTYADFAGALDTLLATHYTDEQIEEAIISVITGLDRPESPWGAVQAAWQLHRRGVDQAMRQQFRQGVLGCTQDALKGAVRKWLVNGAASRAASVGNASLDLAGLQLVDLMAVTSQGATAPAVAP